MNQEEKTEIQALRNYLRASKARKETPARDAAQIGNLLHEVYDYMAQQSATREHAVKFKCGLMAVDEVVEGLRPGELVAIGGYTGGGQTALALHYAIQVAKDTKKPVWIYSQTHSAHQITKRLMSMLTGISITSIEEAQLADKQWNLLSMATSWLKDQDMRVFDLTTDVERLCNSLYGNEEIGLLIIDGAPEYDLEPAVMQEMSRIAKEKQICILFNGPHLVTAPYVEGKVDKVLWVTHLDEDEYSFELLWTRHGKLGRSTLYWNDNCVSFMDEPLYDEDEINE